MHLLGCRAHSLDEARPRDSDHQSTGTLAYLPRKVSIQILIFLAPVVAALQRDRHVLAADGRMKADIDFTQLSGQTVREHLRFDDTDAGQGELPLD